MLSMSVLAAAGAQAAEADQGPTHAQVQAERQQAKVSGQCTFGEEGYPAAIASKSSLTSQQVQEQPAQAKNAGEVTFGNMDSPHGQLIARPSFQAQAISPQSPPASSGGLSF